MDVELPDGQVVEGVPDGMSQRDLVSLLSKNGYDTSWYDAPEPSFVDRVKSALTPSADEPAPGGGMAAEMDTGASAPAEGAISLPGSVMDGYVPAASDQGMPIDAGMGPMRQGYHDTTRAGLLSAPIQAHGAAAQGGGQVGKVAAASLPGRVDRLEREAQGDTQARTAQQFVDDAGQGRTSRVDGELTSGEVLAMSREAQGGREGAKPEGFDVFTNAVMRGIYNNSAMLAGLAAAGAKAAGADDLSLSLLKETFSAQAEAGKYGAQIKDFTHIENWSDVPTYALEGIVENAPQLIGSIGSGVVGGLIAKSMGAKAVAGMMREQAQKELLKRIAIGSAAGAGAASVGMETGSIYGDIARETGEQRPGVAAAFGVVAGALDAIPAFRAARTVLGDTVAKQVASSVVKRYGKEALIQLGAEGGTEFVQTLIEKGAVSYVDGRPVFTEKNMIEAVDAMLKGGIAGAAMGVGSMGIGDAGRAISGRNEDLTTGMQFDPGQIDAAARQSLNPANAQMAAAINPPSLVIPNAIASASSPAEVSAATAELSAEIAASTRAMTDALDASGDLLADPLTESAPPPQTPINSAALPSVGAQPELAAAAPIQPQGTANATQTDQTIESPAALPDLPQAAPAGPALQGELNVPPPQPAPQALLGQRRPVLDDARQVVPQGPSAAALVPDAAAQDQEPDRGAVKVGAGGTAELKIRSAMESGDTTIGKAKPISVEHNGVTQTFLGFIRNVPSAANQRKGLKTPITLARIKVGKMLASMPQQLLVENYTLNGRDVLTQAGNSRPATEADIQQWRDAGLPVPEIAAVKESLTPEAGHPAAAEKSITRIKGGKLDIAGFDRDEVADALKTAKIVATVTAGKDGRILVSVVDRAGNSVKMPIKTQNAISKALLGAPAIPKKPRKLSGNLKNDLDIIAPGLYGEVARGGDGEANDAAWGDVSLIAEKMRDENGYMLPHDASGQDLANALRELIRQHAGGDVVLNEARQSAAMTDKETKRHRSDVLRLADEYGVPAKENGIWRKSEDVLDDVERAIKHEIGLAGRSVVEITKSGVAAGAFTSVEAKTLAMNVAEGYRGDEGRDAKVRMYREIANLLQDKINERESEQSREVGRGSGEGRGTPSEAEAERPALELAGQSEAEARADEERIAAAEAQAREEETRASAAERQARIDAEVASRQDVAADNFTLDAQVNDQAAQRAADKKRADDQLAGQGDIFGAPIDAAANEAATSPKNDKPAPTPAQKEAGNYAMGHIRLHGFDISIENPKGSERVAKDGSWRVPSMPAHYGYIKGTVGADKEHLDVFVGPDPESTKVWIINQVAPNSSPARFDEHKVMIGFGSAEDAKDAYLGSFAGDFGAKVFGSMTQALTIEQLKAKIEGGDLSRKKFVGPVAAEATGGRGVTPDTRPPPKPETPAKTPADAGVSVSAAKQSTAENTPEGDKPRLTIDSVPPARLKKITVAVDALVGDQVQKMDVPAEQALEEIDQEISAFNTLLDCVRAKK